MIIEHLLLDGQTLVERHAGGRPLDTSRDEALRSAALELLAQVGYERLTMDAVASWAGAGKATLYRRWSNKAELVLDALTCEKQMVNAPDTGTLRGDFASRTTKNFVTPFKIVSSHLSSQRSRASSSARLREMKSSRSPTCRWSSRFFPRWSCTNICSLLPLLMNRCLPPSSRTCFFLS